MFKNLKDKYTNWVKTRKAESEEQYQKIIDKLNDEINQIQAEISKIKIELENI